MLSSQFQIDAEDQPGKPIIAGTATGAWTHIVKTANSIRKRDHSNSASGPDYFGFSNATIAKMIQDLPNADKCKSYIMQRFEEPSAKTPSTPEKRKISSLGGSKASKGGGDEVQGGQEDEEDEGNDTFASLGTPGKKTKRSLSPKIRNASLGYGAKDGDVDMEAEGEDEVDELDELDDEETQSEGDPEEGETSLSTETDKAEGSEDPIPSLTASTAAAASPSIVITSADKAVQQTASRKDVGKTEVTDMEV